MEKDILEQLYAKYTRQVYLYIYSLCHNPDLAEDLMQETFLRAFCVVELSGTDILPWLLTVARNLYLDTYRREKRILLGEREEGEGAGGHLERESEVLKHLIRKEENRRLYEAIWKLKVIEREAIVLYYFSGLSQEQISQMLGVSYGSLRVMLYRAKRRLKELLEQEFC